MLGRRRWHVKNMPHQEKTLAGGSANMCGAAAIRRSRAGRVMGIEPMNPRIVLAMAVALAAAVSSGVAQTLTQPNPLPQAQTPPPKDTAKSRHTGHVKTCDAYGAGFRNIPGTDACIKIGGSVTVDVGH
jgi:hypothetical protein